MVGGQALSGKQNKSVARAARGSGATVRERTRGGPPLKPPRSRSRRRSHRSAARIAATATMSTSQPATLLWSVGPKLIPFIKTTCLYFVLQPDQPCLLTVCFKCLPIISLIVFILLNGISLSKEHAFNRRVLTGLIFSCIGDAFLVWPSCFILGVCMFAVAQIMYMSAFGFTPFNAKLGAFVYALAAIVIYTLMPGLDGVLRIGVPVYVLLIGTMSWRAVARIQFFKEQWTWTKLCGGVGSILFVISDTLLGFNIFRGPVPLAQYSIMSTYYVGQLGIALTTVDSVDNKVSVAKR